MRKVTAGLFHSVDGVVQDPFKFQFDSFDEDLGKGLTKMINTVDTVVLGRVSYQEWAGYWPNASQDEDFAAFINPVEKFVASRSLSEPLEWENSHLIEGPLEGVRHRSQKARRRRDRRLRQHLSYAATAVRRPPR